jgi:hypothetical protein
MGKKIMNSNQQSPCSKILQEILPFMGFKGLWHCSLRPTMVPTLSQMNPTHTIPVYAFKIHLIISAHLCLSLLTKAPYIYFSSHVCYMPHQSHSPSFDLPNNIWQKQNNHEASLLATNIFLSILSSNTLHVFFSIWQTKVYTHTK